MRVDEPVPALPGTDQIVQHPDGRTVRYRLMGAKRGPVVIALHGTPGSRLKFTAAHATAAELGLTLVALDRPGYGGTSPPAPHHDTVSALRADVAAVRRARGDEGRYGLLGVSGAGPFACALAADNADVAALALAAPVAPLRDAAGTAPPMSAFHRLCFLRLGPRQAAVRAIFRAFRLGLKVSPWLAMRVATARAPAVDRDVACDPATRARLVRAFEGGLVGRCEGPALDMAQFAEPWTFAPQAIACPTAIWMGLVDTNVPLAPIETLAATIPAATLYRLEGAGHLWISFNYDRAVAWLAETMVAPEAMAALRAATHTVCDRTSDH
ncbi:MAG: alpha/beta fold hydrolase [Pseudomonadota bacterium]